MDFHSFDNGLKQLYEQVSMQECLLMTVFWDTLGKIKYSRLYTWTSQLTIIIYMVFIASSFKKGVQCGDWKANGVDFDQDAV